MNKSKLASRITWRVLLIIVFFNVFVIGAVIIFALRFSQRESEMRAQNLMNGISGKLVNVKKVLEIGAINNVPNIEMNMDSPEKVFDALEYELRLNKIYLGCAAAFEPDYFPSQGRWFEAYVKLENQESEDRSQATVERSQIGSAQHDYFNQEWYQKGFAMERGKGFLSDPYYDEAGGKRVLCSYVSPLFDRQNRKVGVYCIDLNIGWLESSMNDEEIKIKNIEFLGKDPSALDAKGNTIFFQILDRHGKKIAGSETIDDETIQTILKTDSIGYEKMTVNGMSYYVSSKRMKATGWTLVVAQNERFVLLHGYILGIVIVLLMVIGGIVIFLFTSSSIRRAVKPLRFLSDSAREVAQGNFDTLLPTFKHQDEIAQMRNSFDTMQQSLKQYVEELKVSTAAKASMESELNVARRIQMSMLPKKYPPFPKRHDIEIYGMLTPAKAVGGDLFDFFIHDEKLFFCIGDVSGKGVPAALLMTVTRSLFRNISAHVTDPDRIVIQMNNTICEGNDECMFVTLFIGVLDLKTGHLNYCNAGHEAPYIGSALLSCHSNMPIGLMPGMVYKEEETDIAHGSTIFLFTDGLTEAKNAKDELFGKNRVAEVVASLSPDASPQTLIETMTDAVHQFVGDTEQSDDLTMLSIKYQ
jgi:sigma-B regulation protein RsbU (phosphoserine phosphatase)